MICKESVKINKTLLERVNALLAIENLANLAQHDKSSLPKINDCISVLSVMFANRNTINIEVCSNNTHYYNKCVLKDKTGHELTCFNYESDICSEMEFVYDDDNIYIVNLEFE